MVKLSLLNKIVSGRVETIATSKVTMANVSELLVVVIQISTLMQLLSCVF